MTDKAGLESFKSFVARDDEPAQSPDRSGHLSWREGDIEVHPGQRPSRGDAWRKRWRRIDEDGSPSAGHYPHLLNMPESRWQDQKTASWLDHDELSSHRDHIEKLPQDHVKTLLSYKVNSSHFNGALRHPSNHRGDAIHRNDTDATLHDYKRMDNITSHVLREPKDLYRGVASEAGIHRLAPGQTFTDHGYVGTSPSIHTSLDFAGHHDTSPWNKNKDPGVPHELDNHSIIAKIHAPAGTKGHFLDVVGNENDGEAELTLHRGTKFRIDGHERVHRGSNRIHMIHMTVIGQHPKEIKEPAEIKGSGMQAWHEYQAKKYGSGAPSKNTNSWIEPEDHK